MFNFWRLNDWDKYGNVRILLYVEMGDQWENIIALLYHGYHHVVQYTVNAVLISKKNLVYCCLHNEIKWAMIVSALFVGLHVVVIDNEGIVVPLAVLHVWVIISV